MNKLFLSSLIILSSLLVSQEIFDLDEEYLDSLPDGVKEDLEEQMKGKKMTEDPVYRAASTMIDKNIGPDGEGDESLDVFGKKFFDVMQSSFMPINEPNLDNDYILDFGDILEIQLVGQSDFSEEISVRRDGSINIPDVGKIYVAGLSLVEASSLIKAKIKEIFIATEAFISLTNIRDIQILITGNAYNPGIYTLNGNSNILHALNMAGGIDENGSYRNIKHIRNNETINTIDLYNLFIFGKFNSNTRLRSGDSIVVSSSQKIVNVISGVKRPGFYELKDGETLIDLIEFSNGLNSESDLESIKLERTVGENILTSSPSYDDLKTIVAANNDTLIIKEFKFGNVKVGGAVKIPGVYKISEGETLKDIITRAGGYESNAYSFGGYLNNVRSLEINKDAKERLYSSFLRNIIENAGPGNIASDKGSLPLILEELRNAPDTGRVIAEFDLDAISANPDLDTLLEDGDEIMIPLITQQVYVYGEVNNTGAIRYVPNKDVSYYVSGSGGILNSGDKSLIFVVHPNGLTQSINVRNQRISFINGNNRIPIYPGSIIYVPRTAELSNSIQVAAVWAPIISSLALSVASISSLNN